MTAKSNFIDQIQKGYSFKGESIRLGAGMWDGDVMADAEVRVPLATMNRHGLITGATGGGKTKSFQLIAEGLSDAGVPVLLLDIKGDLSGLASQGVSTDKIEERYHKLNLSYQPRAFPVEFLTLNREQGVALRATVSEFGPVLVSKILGLNDTQGGIVSMIFKFCDDNKYPLLDLKDFIKVLQYATGPGKKVLQESYGVVSTTSTGTILRKIIELQQQGADMFFGEKSFEVEDLMRTTADGRGILSILRVNNIQDRPKMFSTFMLQMLDELYAVCPELGDVPKPRLVMFIDEAHLIFKEATRTLVDQIETVIKLIRSKGIGIYFCTQNPMDIPSGILGQLGMKVQHSLRAFTAKDREVIRQTAANYPLSEYYKTEDLITRLGIGEALVTLLNDKGIPTPLVHTMMCTPASRMDVLTEEELNKIAAASNLALKYNKEIDERSAYEMLTEKMESAAVSPDEGQKAGSKPVTRRKEPPTIVEKVGGTFLNTVIRQGSNLIVRSILGSLGLGGRRRK